MKRFVLAFAVLALSSISLAADSNQKKVNSDSPTDINCQFIFTTGSQNTFLRYCITNTGNILGLESPQGHFMVPDDREGYGICDESTGKAYFDYGSLGDNGNWLPPVLLLNKGKTVKIARTTSDGVWTLTQTFNQVTGNTPMSKVTMALKNNTAAARLAFMLRYADTDIDDDTSNNLDGTIESASAWNSVSTANENDKAHGLTLQNVGLTRVTHQALAQDSPSGPNPCNPFLDAPSTPLVQADGAIMMIYQAFVGANSTATATAGYRSF